jgi:hypothetical protein
VRGRERKGGDEDDSDVEDVIFRAAGGGGEPERGATMGEASEVSLIDRREKRLEGGKE